MSRKTQVHEIFDRAVEIDHESERRDYLNVACAENAELRQEVKDLLAAYDHSAGFLADPPVASDSSPGLETVGTIIGHYKLRERLGTGGMGDVYVAEQQSPVTRKVALKIIKPGMDTKQVIARFEAERQALAMMDHPNIARVLDAGNTESGRPYFVMDLVRGLPFTEYCDKQKLSTRQRLELFVIVCHAIQHAHQKGIIHRDIKPSNVLVTRNGDRAVPKVIDFGVAKATNQRLTERTIYTQFNQMIGTPLYMSPEQAEMSELDVDTRSDVYSLGVVLYELLTGSSPFDKEKLNSAGFDEIRRIIRDEDPVTPSNRISTLQAQNLSTVSAQRNCEPRRLNSLVHGELDWITMKALEKDPSRRYESASAFAADVQNYLNGDSVSACPPSVTYRLTKFIRRNKVAMTTTVVVFVALLLGTIGTSWQAWRANSNLTVANDERNRAEHNMQLAMQAIDEAYLQPISDEEFVMSQSDLAMFPVDAHLREALLPTGIQLTLSEQGESRLRRGLAFYEEIAKQNPSSIQAKFQTGKALLRAALIQARLEQHKQALRANTKAISMLRELVEGDGANPDFYMELAAGCYQRGHMKPRNDDEHAFEDALDAVNRAIELDDRNTLAYRLRGKVFLARHEFQRAVSDFQTVVMHRPEDARFHDDLGRLLYFMRDADRALRHAKRAVELAPDNNGRFGYRFHLAEIYRWLKDDSKAAAAVWQDGLRFTNSSSQEYAVRSRITELLGENQKSVELIAKWLLTEPNVCEAYLRRADAYRKLNDENLALADLRKAIELATCDWDWIMVNWDYASQGKNADALVALNHAERLNPTNPYIYSNRGERLNSQERYGEALAAYDKCLELAPLMQFVYSRRAEVYFKLGDYRKAHTEIVLRLDYDPYGTLRWLLTWLPLLEAAYEQDQTFKHDFEETVRTVLDKCSQAIELQPDTSKQWQCRGIAYQLLGQTQQAIANYSQASNLDPDNAKMLNNNARYLLISWQLDQRIPAQACLLARKSVKLAPDEWQTWRTLGLSLYRLGDYEQSADALNTAMKLDRGSNGWNYVLLAMGYWQLGQHDDAREHYHMTIDWMNRPNRRPLSSLSEELNCFIREAETLMDIPATTPVQ